MSDSGITLLQQRFDRRTLIRGGVLGGVGLATAAVIGCGGDDDDDGSASGGSTSAKPAKTVHLNNGASGGPPSLDPSSTAAADDIFWGIYDAPTRLDRDFNVVPHLASSWERNPSNELEWIFNLNEADWSDGTKMTAEDVAFTYDYYRNPDNGSRLISRVGTVASTRVIDDQTVGITTKSLDPIIPRRAMFVLTIPKHIFEDSARGPAHQAQNGVGTGSYVAQFSDEKTELEASGTAWNSHSGVSSVSAFKIPEQTTRIAAFETNEIDIVAAIPTAEFPRVSGFSGAEVAGGRATSQLGWDIEYFEGPTADPRVRTAIAHSMDVQTMVDVIWNGTTQPMHGQIAPEGIFGYTDRLKAFGYDPAESKRLLADAGFPNGFNIDFEFVSPYQPETKSFAEASAGYLNDVGIGTSVIPIELNVWRDGLYGNKQRAPIHYSPWSCFAAEVSFAMTWYRKDNPGKFYDNPEWEAAYNAATAEVDDEKRRELYGDASVIAFNDPPAFWALESKSLYGWRPSVVEWSPRVYPRVEFDNVKPA
jgi:peptide/nickel transport system substrate-binding protein